MRFKPFLVILIALALGVATITLFWNVVRATAKANSPTPTEAPAVNIRQIEEPSVTFVDQVQGPKDAAVTIVEFGDYLCPHCQAAEEAIQRLLKEQPSRIRYVWKDMPSPLHAGADTAAEAGLCAAKQGSFWNFHRLLFEAQSSFDETLLAFQADQAGLDTQAFASCLSSHEMRPMVERTIEEGLGLGVDALPTFFINGKRYVGALTYEELKEATR